MKKALATTFNLLFGFNTASGKHYCNPLELKHRWERVQLVSIPQAVSTIAMASMPYADIYLERVSIPQAVSTIAIS